MDNNLQGSGTNIPVSSDLPSVSNLPAEAPVAAPFPPESAAASEPEKPAFQGDAEHPLAVTEVYSSYGIEYLIMLITLAISAISLSSLMSSIVDLASAKSGSILSTFLDPYAEAALIVSFPIFVLLFLRLEAKEESDSSLINDASRRRGLQITLVISFLIFISQLVGYIGGLLSSSDDSGYGSFSWFTYSPEPASAAIQLLHAFIGLATAAAVFFYCWYKLHKKSGAIY